MNTRTYKLLLTLSHLIAVSHAFGVNKFLQLPDLLKPQPYCEGKIVFSIAKESFVEIANDLPGVREYNEMVKLYQKQEWTKFKYSLQQYKNIYETSPLVEAAQFLEVQAVFEQIDRSDYNESTEAEKLLKKVVLLYPKSELIPILYGSLISLWMKDGLVAKALGYLEKVKKEYPFHSMSCYFQLASGEASFLIRDYTSSKRVLTQLKQKCTERKYLVGAETRLNDMMLREKGDSYLSEYEKPFYSDVNTINRFYPFVLYNLGELKFHQKEYKSSKLFFTEFAKYGGKDPECGPMALKRLADLAMLMNEDIKTVVGKYLSVQDQAPLTDIGKYSYIHALLLQFPEVSEIEQKRRIKNIDSEIEKITNYDLRSLAFLEKGLALLTAGHSESLEYLVNLAERSNYNLKSGELADYVREQIVHFQESQASSKLIQTKRVDTLADEAIFNPYEKVYGIWLKGSRFEANSKVFYKKVVFARYEKALASKDGLSAVAKLVRWKKSDLWSPNLFHKKDRKIVGDMLATYLKKLNTEEIKELATNLKKYRSEMEEFFNPEYHLLLVALDLPSTEKAEILSHYQKMQKKRELATFEPSVSKEAMSYLYRVRGKMLFAVDKFSEAEDYLKKAQKDKAQKVEVEEELIQLYEQNKQYDKLLKLSLSIFDANPSEKTLHYLETAKISIGIGKIWSASGGLLKRAEKQGLKDKEILPYKLLNARSSYELGKCKVAIENYEPLLKEELPLDEQAGAKFRFAKCQSMTKQNETALKIFDEVIAMKDSFWSPLASSEKNLLEIK